MMKGDPYTKINSKWATDLNVRPETTTARKKKSQGKDFKTDFGNDFIDMMSRAQTTKAKIDKWSYIKLKTSTQQ